MMTLQAINRPSVKDYLARHEEKLRGFVSISKIPATLIQDAMLYALFPGGKRLRPLLIYACGELLNLPIDCLDIMAAAVEMIHAYSLIHDDLPAMDNDDLRRGRPTCHRAFDEATAILVGDGLQALAVEILLEKLPKYLCAETVIRVTTILMQACGPAGMISGQSLDLDDTSNHDQRDLQLIHQLKTGLLIQACIDMTLAAGKPSVTETQSLKEFAQQLGLLFQIQDDYLDCYASSDILGKGRSSDLANQKQTFASLYTKEELASEIKDRMHGIKQCLNSFGSTAENLYQILSIVEKPMIESQNSIVFPSNLDKNN